MSAELWSQQELADISGFDVNYCRKVVGMLEPVTARKRGAGKRYHVAEIFAAIMEIERNKRVSFDSSDAKQRAEMARAEKLEIENAVRRGELVSLIDQVATDSKAASMLARKLESIPGRIKRKYPDMPGKYLAALADALAVARNEHVEEFEALVKEGIHEATDEDEAAAPAPAAKKKTAKKAAAKKRATKKRATKKTAAKKVAAKKTAAKKATARKRSRRG